MINQFLPELLNNKTSFFRADIVKLHKLNQTIVPKYGQSVTIFQFMALHAFFVALKYGNERCCTDEALLRFNDYGSVFDVYEKSSVPSLDKIKCTRFWLQCLENRDADENVNDLWVKIVFSFAHRVSGESHEDWDPDLSSFLENCYEILFNNSVVDINNKSLELLFKKFIVFINRSTEPNIENNDTQIFSAFKLLYIIDGVDNLPTDSFDSSDLLGDKPPSYWYQLYRSELKTIIRNGTNLNVGENSIIYALRNNTYEELNADGVIDHGIGRDPNCEMAHHLNTQSHPT